MMKNLKRSLLKKGPHPKDARLASANTSGQIRVKDVETNVKELSVNRTWGKTPLWVMFILLQTLLRLNLKLILCSPWYGKCSTTEYGLAMQGSTLNKDATRLRTLQIRYFLSTAQTSQLGTDSPQCLDTMNSFLWKGDAWICLWFGPSFNTHVCWTGNFLLGERREILSIELQLVSSDLPGACLGESTKLPPCS